MAWWDDIARRAVAAQANTAPVVRSLPAYARQTVASVYPTSDAQVLDSLGKLETELNTNPSAYPFGFTWDPRASRMLQPGSEQGTMMSHLPNDIVNTLPFKPETYGTDIVSSLLSNPAAMRSLRRGGYAGGWPDGGVLYADAPRRHLTEYMAGRMGQPTGQLTGFNLRTTQTPTIPELLAGSPMARAGSTLGNALAPRLGSGVVGQLATMAEPIAGTAMVAKDYQDDGTLGPLGYLGMALGGRRVGREMGSISARLLRGEPAGMTRVPRTETVSRYTSPFTGRAGGTVNPGTQVPEVNPLDGPQGWGWDGPKPGEISGTEAGSIMKAHATDFRTRHNVDSANILLDYNKRAFDQEAQFRGPTWGSHWIDQYSEDNPRNFLTKYVNEYSNGTYKPLYQDSHSNIFSDFEDHSFYPVGDALASIHEKYAHLEQAGIPRRWTERTRNSINRYHSRLTDDWRYPERLDQTGYDDFSEQIQAISDSLKSLTETQRSKYLDELPMWDNTVDSLTGYIRAIDNMSPEQVMLAESLKGSFKDDWDNLALTVRDVIPDTPGSMVIPTPGNGGLGAKGVVNPGKPSEVLGDLGILKDNNTPSALADTIVRQLKARTSKIPAPTKADPNKTVDGVVFDSMKGYPKELSDLGLQPILGYNYLDAGKSILDLDRASVNAVLTSNIRAMANRTGDPRFYTQIGDAGLNSISGANLGREYFAGAVGPFSMGTSVPRNIRLGKRFIEHPTLYPGRFKGEGTTTAGNAWNMALKSMVSDNPLDPQHYNKLGNRVKIGSFVDNIGAPKTSDAVTVDRHAVQAALGIRPVTDGTIPNLQDLEVYKLFEDAYIQVANELGVLPHELQSSVWDAWRSLMVKDPGMSNPAEYFGKIAANPVWSLNPSSRASTLVDMFNARRPDKYSSDASFDQWLNSLGIVK